MCCYLSSSFSLSILACNASASLFRLSFSSFIQEFMSSKFFLRESFSVLQHTKWDIWAEVKTITIFCYEVSRGCKPEVVIQLFVSILPVLDFLAQFVVELFFVVLNFSGLIFRLLLQTIHVILAGFDFPLLKENEIWWYAELQMHLVLMGKDFQILV